MAEAQVTDRARCFFGTLLSLLVACPLVGGCRTVQPAFPEWIGALSRGETGCHWKSEVVPMRGGPVSYTAGICQGTRGGPLVAQVVIHPNHSQGLFFLDPERLSSNFSDVHLWGEAPTITAEIGWPAAREYGLLKLQFIPPRAAYRAKITLAEHLDLSKVQTLRLRLVFLPDPNGSFAREFAMLEDTGITWHTEVGSSIWCRYMSELVYEEVTIRIRTNVHVCE